MATEFLPMSRAAGDLLLHALDRQLPFLEEQTSAPTSLTTTVKTRLAHAQANDVPCTLTYVEFIELHRAWLAAVDTLGLADAGLEEPLMRLYFLPLTHGDRVHITIHARAVGASVVSHDMAAMQLVEPLEGALAPYEHSPYHTTREHGEPARVVPYLDEQ